MQSTKTPLASATTAAAITTDDTGYLAMKESSGVKFTVEFADIQIE